MKSICVVFAVFAAMGAAQTPPVSDAPKLPPETVIAVVEGKNLTYGEIEKYMRGLPPQMQQNALRNRREFVREYALMMRLSEAAEKSKLDEKSPYKESLAFNRMNILMQAAIHQEYENIVIQLDDQQKYYDANKSRYQEVKLKVIYIPFSSNASGAPADGKKHLTEEEAKAKAGQLVKDARGGADFVKLVKENSEDSISKDKDGDFGAFTRTDKLPDSISSVVFALKAGEVSEPVRQPNGFYIFRAESVSEKPFSEVRDLIYTELKNARLRDWMENTTKSLNVKFENEQFFSPPALPNPGAPLSNK